MNKVDKAGRSGNEKVIRDLFVEVPRGWSRGLEKDNVVYISPTSECLRSKEDVVNYLVSPKTCKCGLECPLYLDKTFNFDADIPSRHFRISDWDKDGHTTICKQTLGAMNAYKYSTPAWAKTGGTKDDTKQAFQHSSMARPEQEESVVKSDGVDISKVRLSSLKTLTKLPEQKHNENLQGQAKSKKPSQARRAGCYKRKPTTASQDLSTVSSGSEASKNMQECKTVTSTSTPIPHSYVKNDVKSEQSKDVISLTQHTPLVSNIAARQEQEQRYPGLNINSVPLVSFPSSHFNASSYLASLSTGGSANVPNLTPSNDLPYLHSHAGGMLHPSLVQTVTASHALANTSAMDGPSFTHKPVTTVFTAGATSTTYLSSSANTKTNQKPIMTLQECSSLSNNTALPPSSNNVGKSILGKSKAGFSMKNAGNFPSTNNRYSPQCTASTATASLPVTCDASSSAMAHAKTHVVQQDIPLASKSLASAHGPQTSRVNSMDVSEKGEVATPRAVYSAAAMMTHADKNKQRPSTAASSKPSESVNQPFQYCGILLPTTGMVPQVQVAGGSGIQLQQASPRVDPSHFTNLYALQGIPYANNVGALGSSGVFGMNPGTVVPYVLGIAQTAATTKATAVTTTTSKVSPTSPSVMPISSTPSTGSAAIAAAYSAFVSIAPASGTSSSYSQQLMNLVNSYSSPYWQQLLSHGPNANALAYQLMQMNQYTALRGAAGQPATNVKTSTTKSVTSQAKQATTTAATSASSPTAAPPQGVATTPVALVVLGSKDQPSASSTSNRTTGNVEMAVAKTSSQTTVSSECAIKKTIKKEDTSATETSSASNLSTIERKVTETTTTVRSTFSKNNNTRKTCDVAPKQEVVDHSTKNVGIHCDSRQNEEKKTDREGDAKSIPQISHENFTNKETLSDGLDSSENKNSEDVNVDKSFALSCGNVEDACRTCENTPALSEEGSKECANDDSSVNVTDVNHEEDMSVNSAIEDKPFPPDESTNSERLDTTHTIQEDTKEDIDPEKTPKIDLEDEKHVELGKRDKPERKDEDKTDFKTIRQNGEAQSSSNDVKSASVGKKDEEEEEYHPAEFTIGDVVWAQARGLPSWPGKIVDDVGGVRADNGKKWVMWFGDHNHSQVEVEKLKTLSEGLKTLDDKGKKRKYRGKKTRIGLEQAIGEALEELDQKERLRSRQGPKAKKRRLCV